MGNPVVLIYLNYLIFNAQIVTCNCHSRFPAGKQVVIVVEFLEFPFCICLTRGTIAQHMVKIISIPLMELACLHALFFSV